MTDTFRFDEEAHAYFLNDKPLMGITTVLGVIAKNNLIQWAANEAVKYMGDLEHRHTNSMKEFVDIWGAPCPPDYMPELTIFRSKDFTKGLEEARYAHRKKKEAAGESGTDLHALAEGYVRLSIQENESRPMDVCPAGLEQFRDWAKQENVTFLASEKRMYSKAWWVAGTCDLIFEKEGKKYIGDIKTYAKIWDRVPFFQCAGYANLYEEMHADEPQTKEDNHNIAGYCVIRISKDNTFETKWSFDTVGDTKAFFACVELYKQLQNYKI